MEPGPGDSNLIMYSLINALHVLRLGEDGPLVWETVEGMFAVVGTHAGVANASER